MSNTSKKNPQSITIYDVAREAGVSDATVSRVFNNKSNVREATRQRVLNAAKKLGYVANLQARSLAGGQSKIIGLLVPTLDTAHIGQVVRGIDHELAKAGYEIMLYTTRHRDSADYLKYIANSLSEGLLLVIPVLSQSYLSALKNLNYPYVLIDETDPSGESMTVNATNWQGAYDATEYLLQLGHRKIGFIKGLSTLNASTERLKGYQAALIDYGIEPDDEIILDGDFLPETGYTQSQTLLDLPTPPSAIFAANDRMAIGAMDAIREYGLAIPDDMSIVGFDDIPQSAVTSPKLTTVRQPLEQMGKAGAQLLLDKIQHPDQAPQYITMATQLIIRESCKAISYA